MLISSNGGYRMRQETINGANDMYSDVIKQPNQQILRGDKFKEYTMKQPVDTPYYDGDIWNPNIGEKIIGEYITCLNSMGKYNQKLYVIDTDRLDERYDKIFGCATLDRQMSKIHPNTVIEIRYLGKNNERNYHEYKVSKLSKQE